MRKLAGWVFDAYDDIDGHILRSFYPTADAVPDLVKTAEHLDEERIRTLPDDLFALVLFEEGHKLKKYATIDAGNTTLSVLYLLKQAHLLPSEAVKVAANNLIAACQEQGIKVPEQLKVAAHSGTSMVSGKTQKPYAKGAKSKPITFSQAHSQKESEDSPQLGKHDAANDDVDQRTNMNSVQGSNFVEMPLFPGKEKQAAPEGVEVRTKQKSWRQAPYVDVTGWDPGAATASETVAPQQTLLDGHYPIDGYDQVKTASVYFTEHWKQFHPRDRHEYCVKLAARMEELGIRVPEDVARYGSTTYAADSDAYVESRRGWLHDEFKPALDMLVEKRAHVSPETFAEALSEFDDMSGLRWHWDVQIPDPWISTFGPSIEKLAEDNWVFDDGGAHIREVDLANLARNGGEFMQKAFGPEFFETFRRSPKATFEKQSKEIKIVLARAAMDARSFS